MDLSAQFSGVGPEPEPTSTAPTEPRGTTAAPFSGAETPAAPAAEPAAAPAGRRRRKGVVGDIIGAAVPPPPPLPVAPTTDVGGVPMVSAEDMAAIRAHAELPGVVKTTTPPVPQPSMAEAAGPPTYRAPSYLYPYGVKPTAPGAAPLMARGPAPAAVFSDAPKIGPRRSAAMSRPEPNPLPAASLRFSPTQLAQATTGEVHEPQVARQYVNDLPRRDAPIVPHVVNAPAPRAVNMPVGPEGGPWKTGPLGGRVAGTPPPREVESIDMSERVTPGGEIERVSVNTLAEEAEIARRQARDAMDVRVAQGIRTYAPALSLSERSVLRPNAFLPGEKGYQSPEGTRDYSDEEIAAMRAPSLPASPREDPYGNLRAAIAEGKRTGVWKQPESGPGSGLEHAHLWDAANEGMGASLEESLLRAGPHVFASPVAYDQAMSGTDYSQPWTGRGPAPVRPVVAAKDVAHNAGPLDEGGVGTRATVLRTQVARALTRHLDSIPESKALDYANRLIARSDPDIMNLHDIARDHFDSPTHQRVFIARANVLAQKLNMMKSGRHAGTAVPPESWKPGLAAIGESTPLLPAHHQAIMDLASHVPHVGAFGPEHIKLVLDSMSESQFPRSYKQTQLKELRATGMTAEKRAALAARIYENKGQLPEPTTEDLADMAVNGGTFLGLNTRERRQANRLLKTRETRPDHWQSRPDLQRKLYGFMEKVRMALHGDESLTVQAAGSRNAPRPLTSNWRVDAAEITSKRRAPAEIEDEQQVVGSILNRLQSDLNPTFSDAEEKGEPEKLQPEVDETEKYGQDISGEEEPEPTELEEGGLHEEEPEAEKSDEEQELEDIETADAVAKGEITETPEETAARQKRIRDRTRKKAREVGGSVAVAAGEAPEEFRESASWEQVPTVDVNAALPAEWYKGKVGQTPAGAARQYRGMADVSVGISNLERAEKEGYAAEEARSLKQPDARYVAQRTLENLLPDASTPERDEALHQATGAALQRAEDDLKAAYTQALGDPAAPAIKNPNIKWGKKGRYTVDADKVDHPTLGLDYVIAAKNAYMDAHDAHHGAGWDRFDPRHQVYRDAAKQYMETLKQQILNPQAAAETRRKYDF